MTHLLFIVSTVLLWLCVSYVWSLLPRSAEQDDNANFDMTTEMSRSGGYSMRLILTGICSALVVLIAFVVAGLI